MKFPRRTFLHLAAGAAALPAVSRIAWAQAYPTRPVRIIVPYPPGGAPDIVARLMGQWISDRLGQQFIIENRPGAGGNIGTEAAVRAPSDGYTLLYVVTANAISPALFDKLNFSFIRDIAPVAGVLRVPNLVSVTPSLPVETIPELIAFAKANPGKLNFSSAGTGGAAHIAMAAFNVASGTTMTHVPYRGTPQSVGDVISGQVQATFTSGVSLLPHVRAGRLRALGVSTRERLAIAPEIPAIAETLPGFDLSAWYGIVGPAGLPEPVVQRLHQEIRNAMASPDITRRLNAEGAVHWDVSPQAFRDYVVAETTRWKSVIEAAKIRIE